jgi:hypothetical protein
MILRELITKFGFHVDAEKLKKMGNDLEGIKDKLEDAGKAAGRFGTKLTTRVTLPVLGLGVAFVKTASDAEEAESKFAAVFSNIEGDANKASGSLAKNFGLSQKEAKGLLADTGDLLTGFGFSQDSALDLSNQVQQLAVDLASFTNFSGGAEGASKALSKALLGERESIKSLGIAILEEDVKARVLLNTQNGITFATERQAKAYATLALAQEQSKNAIGDFSRTSHQFANQWRIMKGRILDASISFGKILLPSVLKIVKAMVRFFTFMEKMSKSTKTLILIVLGLAAAVGPLLLIFSSLIGMIGFAATGFTALAGAVGLSNVALGLLMLKFAAIALVAVAAFAALFLIVDDLIAFANGENSITGVVLDKLIEGVKWLSEAFQELPNGLKIAIAALTTPLRGLLAIINGLAEAVGNLFTGNFAKILPSLGGIFSNMFDPDTVLNGGIGGLLGFGADKGSQADLNNTA